MRGFQLSFSWKALAEHKAQNNSDRPNKERERRSVTSQAPPLLRQRKPYLTGSPPSRQERRCRQKMSGDPIITREHPPRIGQSPSDPIPSPHSPLPHPLFRPLPPPALPPLT